MKLAQKTEQKQLKLCSVKEKIEKQLFSPEPHAAHVLPVARGALCGGYYLPLLLQPGPWPA
jgi:hypothetical protein